MIDAYEIGIQLLLQDGVSAGLAVIGRDLAQVDEAIAATNAGLVTLVQNAEKASKAVASGVGRGPNIINAPREETSIPSPETSAAAPSPSKPAAAPSISAVPEAEMPVAPVPMPQRQQEATQPAAPVNPVKGRAPVETVPELATRQSDAPSPIINSNTDRSAPHKLVVLTAETPAPPIPQPMSAASAPAPRDKQTVTINHDVPAVVARAAAAPAISARETEGERPARRLERIPSAMTSSVQRAVAPIQEANKSPPRRMMPPPSFAEGTSRQKVTAPWTGARPQNPGTTAGPVEQAAAPAANAAEKGEAGGGAVMLDGRLVGHWLSDQMAKDAARPPAGTTYFDARQTPGWTISGAF